MRRWPAGHLPSPSSTSRGEPPCVAPLAWWPSSRRVGSPEPSQDSPPDRRIDTVTRRKDDYRASRRFPTMKIAVGGSGVSGLIATWLLRNDHDVTLYEKGTCIGGHANTEYMKLGERTIPVDTAFITFSTQRYPTFSRLLQHLDVRSQPVPTSFSCHIEGRDVQYVYGPQRTRF